MPRKNCRIFTFKVHTILNFEVEGKVVYLELTPQFSKSWYGHEIVHSNLQDFIQEYKNNGYDVSDVTHIIKVGQQPKFLIRKRQRTQGWPRLT